MTTSTAIIPYTTATEIIPYTIPVSSEQFIYRAVEKEIAKLVAAADWTDLPSRISELIVQNTKTVAASNLNSNKIAEVLQSEAGFTVADDVKPIVATYGCGPCVAVGGYDPTNKIAFLVHFANAREVRESGGMIFFNIHKLVKKTITTPIQLHLRGGYQSDKTSEKTIEAIKIWMRQRKEDLPMEIASEDILGTSGSKSLSIDSRTGKISEYHPTTNLKSREISERVALRIILSSFQPEINLAYSPQ